MNRHRREDDPEIMGPRREREAREERIMARVLVVFLVALLASALVAAKGSADIYSQWRSAAYVAVDAFEHEP